jgi:hypothetical protein
MIPDDRITNGLENDNSPGAGFDNDTSMQAEIIQDLEGEYEINSETDMRAAFASIRDEAETSPAAANLTLLYRRGADLLELLDRPRFQERVGGQLDEIRRAAEEEFARNAHVLNHRAREVGAKTHYAEEWKRGDPAK